MRIRTNAALALIMICACGTATAQETVPSPTAQQTIEGAHRFLGLITSQTKILYQARYWDKRDFNFQYSPKFTSNEECVTEISPDGGEYFLLRGAWYSHDISPNSTLLPFNNELFESALSEFNTTKGVRIEWSRVSTIEMAKSDGWGSDYTRPVLILIKSGQWTYPLNILVMEESMLVRIHYAMNFLKYACDPTAATAF